MSALAQTIAGQPAALDSVLGLDLDSWSDRLGVARRILLVGTGTSQHAAELGVLMLDDGTTEVGWSSAAAFARRRAGFRSGDAVVVISHTGETAFARRARNEALAAGATVIPITGIGRGWEDAIETSPAERSETYTASYTAALLVLARLAVAIGRAPFAAADLSLVPDRVRDALDAPDELGALVEQRLLVLIGSGPTAVTAREGALKLREASRLAAEGYEAEYLLHGSAVPLGSSDALVVLQPTDDPFGLAAAVGAAAAAAGVSVTEISEPPGLHALLTQIPLTVRLQALASRVADERGLDPDHVIAGAWATDDLWQAGAPES